MVKSHYSHYCLVSVSVENVKLNDGKVDKIQDLLDKAVTLSAWTPEKNPPKL